MSTQNQNPCPYEAAKEDVADWIVQMAHGRMVPHPMALGVWQAMMAAANQQKRQDSSE